MDAPDEQSNKEIDANLIVEDLISDSDETIRKSSEQNEIVAVGRETSSNEQQRAEGQHLSIRHLRKIIGTILDSTKFQLFIVSLIIINSSLMGLATYDFIRDSNAASTAFEIIDKIFLILFTIELLMQFIYRGVKLFLDGWLLFDFVIIVLSWSLDSLQVVRTFRVFRALRLVTRVKVLKNLVTALFSVAPRIFIIFCLLMLVFYIYGVMCTVLFQELYKEGYTEYDYFSSLDRSIWTLLVMMTLEWSDVSRQVMSIYPWSWPIFTTFIMITSFIAYNLIVAVVCDSVSIIEKQDNESNASEEVQDEVDAQINHSNKILSLLERISEMTLKQHLLIEEIQKELGGESDVIQVGEE
jgi:Ion transport protein